LLLLLLLLLELWVRGGPTVKGIAIWIFFGAALGGALQGQEPLAGAGYQKSQNLILLNPTPARRDPIPQVKDDPPPGQEEGDPPLD
jgi:hypothetical protein